MSNNLPIFLISCLLLALLSSCSLERPYTPPCIEVCETWKNTDEQQQNDPIPLPIFWWEIFHDPILDYLETQALAANPTLKKAEASLMQAAAQADQQYAPLLPKVILNPSIYHAATTVPNFFGNIAQGNTQATGISPVIAIPSPKRIQERIYQFPFSATYEVDLWGKNCMTYKAAEANAASSFHQLRQAWLMLTVQVAQYYYQIRTLDSQIAVLDKTLESRNQALRMNQERFDKGLSIYTDVTNAKVELADVETNKEELLRQRGLNEDVLATLLGQAASCFSLPSEPLEGPPPEIPPGLPCSVLIQRPDLAAAERLLFMAQEEIGIAKTAYLPSLNLTGQLGYESFTFHQLFDWQSRLWSYGVQIAQTIFDAGAIKSGVEAAVAVYLQRLADYENVVVRAFREVEDALVNARAADKKSGHITNAVENAGKTYDLTNKRYLAGISNYLDVVNTERTWLNEQLSQAQVDGDKYQAMLSLIEAMGGTW